LALDYSQQPRRIVSTSKTIEATTATVTEMELSADDLLSFAAVSESQPTSRVATPVALPIAASTAVIVQPSLPAQEQGSAERARRSNATVVTFASLAFVVTAAVAAWLSFSGSSESPGLAANSFMTASTSFAKADEPVEEESPAPVSVVEPPVRIVNSFDKTEVFEFPAGTSKAEARAAVADILMKRALERRERFAARSTQ
jgi:hypothetical protein